MIRSTGFTVVLDACVLYPAPIRDILLSLAAEDLFKAKWSEIIQDEWLRNLLKNRPDLKKEQLIQTVKAMNFAFPEANVENFEELIPSLKLPDKEDRHVLACAIRCHADLISNVIDINPESACRGFHKMVKRLVNPKKTKHEILTTLEKCGLNKCIEKLKNNC